MPLLLVGLFGMINEVSDKVLFKFLITVPPDVVDQKDYILSQLGIYGANYRLAVLMTLFIQMFRYAAEPFFFNHAKEENAKALYAVVMKYFIIFCLLIFLGVSLFIDVFKYFIGIDFRVGLHIVPVILLANLFLGIFYNLSVWYKLTDKTRFGAYIALAGAIITISLNILLVPRYGYTGAAWAHLACYFSMVILSFILGREYYKVSYDLKNIGLYFFIAAAIYILSIYVEPELEVIRFGFYAMLILGFLGFAILNEKKSYLKSFK